MSSLPKISVITPSYNQAQYLEACLKSVIDQSYPNLEYIVLDGGSTDNSAEIIEKHKSSIHYWHSKKDDGQSDAINTGLRMATGDIICWLNSDDLFLDGALEAVAKAWQECSDKKHFWCIGNAQEKDENTGESKSYPRDMNCNPKDLYWGHNICQPASFWSRDLKLYLDETLHYALDWELWIRMSHTSQPTFIDDFLAVNRIYDETKTNTGKKSMADEFYYVSKKYSKKKIKAWLIRYSYWELSYQFNKAPNHKSFKFRIWTKLNNTLLPMLLGKQLKKDYKWEFFA